MIYDSVPLSESPAAIITIGIRRKSGRLEVETWEVIWADAVIYNNMRHFIDIVTDGQVRRGALAVHLAAPLRRRKSTFGHRPYGAADIAMRRVH